MFTRLIIVGAILGCQFVSSASAQNGFRRQSPKPKPDKPHVLKDAFYEDNAYIVKIKTTYNQTASISCNAVALEQQLVLSDVSCIRYQGMANIDAKYVQVLAGELGYEKTYNVDAIYLRKSDPKDPGTELAVLKLSSPLVIDSQCRSLLRPEKFYSIETGSKVRVIGYTGNNDLKENRTYVAGKTSEKYICTTPADLFETPGSSMLRGAPLLNVIDCKQYQLIGVFTKVDVITDLSSNTKKHQDCYVAVSLHMKWFDQVRTLAFLAGKVDGGPVIRIVSDDGVIL